MPAEIITIPFYATRPRGGKGVYVISTVSKADYPWCQLSPFTLGPCELYWGYRSKNMENAWQYSKVYEEHVVRSRSGTLTKIKPEYWVWATAGWINQRAVRYPMGKGKKPLFSYWNDECLPYVEARKWIYGPLYAEAVQKTDAYRVLKDLYKEQKQIYLIDYDVRDTRESGESLTEVLNNPKKKMGHAFVLSMLLQNDPALEQMRLR